MGTEPWKEQIFVQVGAANAASWINWYDASTCCAKLGMRLPTDSEWEYACRAGTTTCYHWGENCPPPAPRLLNNYAWNDNNTSLPPEHHPHPVGQKLPNAFGLHDINGNVDEWCLDEHKGNYNRVPTNGAPLETGLCTGRVLRGGYWGASAWWFRSSSRQYQGCVPWGRDYRCGFRVARSLR
ncbi:MAG: formylglycine-generating enzyme family protein [Planctomycetes bacterium]|nr:formylglycine-generating enzyme family protein [Planctomycetota bacterium]